MTRTDGIDGYSESNDTTRFDCIISVLTTGFQAVIYLCQGEYFHLISKHICMNYIRKQCYKKSPLGVIYAAETVQFRQKHIRTQTLP